MKFVRAAKRRFCAFEKGAQGPRMRAACVRHLGAITSQASSSKQHSPDRPHVSIVSRHSVPNRAPACTPFNASLWSQRDRTAILSAMSERVFEPTDHVVEKSRLPSFEQYQSMHQESLEDPESFWSELANEFYWQTPYQRGNILSYNFNVNKGKIFVKWLEGSKTNICFNVLDRNVRNGYGDRIAFYW